MITKKLFKELSDIHEYGRYIKVLYFDHKRDFEGEKNICGYKFAIAAQGITKKDLINLAYDRLIKNEIVYHNGWLGYRIAKTDEKRFKDSLAFSFDSYNDSQIIFEKETCYHIN